MSAMSRSEVTRRITAARAKGEQPDLQGVHLSGVDLFGADLSGADLTGADLTGATLHGANLTDATLTRADLTDATLTRADLRDANLTGANLTNASLWGEAPLEDATLADDPMTLIDHDDSQFRAWAARRITDPAVLMQLAMDDAEIVRAAVLENPNCSDETRVVVTLQR